MVQGLLQLVFIILWTINLVDNIMLQMLPSGETLIEIEIIKKRYLCGLILFATYFQQIVRWWL